MRFERLIKSSEKLRALGLGLNPYRSAGIASAAKRTRSATSRALSRRWGCQHCNRARFGRMTELAVTAFLANQLPLEATGVAPMTEEEIADEVTAARAERRARQQGGNPQAGKGAA